MSAFNLTEQNENFDSRIVAGLERLSLAFRILLWEKAKKHNLSPIQIQILIFVESHSAEKSTVSYLAKEFNLTKPTISDAVRILEQKKLIKKYTGASDSRSYTIGLTENGKKIAAETENFPDPIQSTVTEIPMPEKEAVWDMLRQLLVKLNRMDIISVQRTCPQCRFYSGDEKTHYCQLLNVPLENKQIRLDCPEFESAL